MKINMTLAKVAVTLGITLLLTAATAFANPAPAPRQQISCDSVATYAAEIPPLRGLAFKNDVPCRLQTREEVQKYLLSKINKEDMAAKLDREEIIFKAIGMIPYEYPYRAGLVELYRDQVGGFYEPEEKYYAFASWLPASMQGPIAVHELTHALQDQHFNLENFMDDKLKSDFIIARSALVEGDATVIMTDYTRQYAGMKRLQDEENVSALMLQTVLGATVGGSIKNAPPALQAMIIFPYVSGLKFAHALLREGGFDLVNKALKNPPRSSSEILHPEKYLKYLKEGWGDSTLSCSTDLPQEIANSSPIHEDILGEFGVSALFVAHGESGKAPKLAAKWKEDRACLFEIPAGSSHDSTNEKKYFLSWEHRWESEEAAESFMREIQIHWAKRLGSESIKDAAPGSVIEVNKNGVEKIVFGNNNAGGDGGSRTLVRMWLGKKD